MNKTPLSPMSAKRRAEFATAGVPAFSTFLPRAREARAGRPRKDTGPSRPVRGLVSVRSGDLCEWLGCGRPKSDLHHRCNRKAGGRHGEMAETLNLPAWLLACCRHHHNFVTSPVGGAREIAIRYGWLLLEGQDAPTMPVLTAHNSQPVLLNNRGGWAVAV